MNFLLTNDEGITAPGLWAAARALATFGTVLVVAPAGNCSGFGAALPPMQDLTYFPYHDGDMHPPCVIAYGLDATPATCALVALSGVFGHAPFDLVVSGVNLGANMGRDIFYSGTVGAALTAQLLSVPAMAFSLDTLQSACAEWATAEWAVRRVMEMWLYEQEPAPLLFNVNVPNQPVASLTGVHLTSPGRNTFLTQYRFEPKTTAPYTLSATQQRDSAHEESALWTDSWAVEQGYISLTPMQPLPELMPVAPWYPAGLSGTTSHLFHSLNPAGEAMAE